MKFFVFMMLLLAGVVTGLPVFSASKGPVSSGQPFTVLTPRGSGLDDTANIQAAVNAAGNGLPPVMLTAGQYQVCSQITISNDGTVLRGPAPNNGDNGNTAPPLPASVHIGCPTAGSFTNGQAFLLINARSVTVMNLQFQGLQGVGGAANVDCIQTLAGGNMIIWNSFGDCYNGVHLNAVNTGCCGTFNQTSHVEHNIMTYNGGAGILCEATTGSGCTDNFFNFNHVDVLFLNADIYCNLGCGNNQFIGNRLEDGGVGFWFNGPSPSGQDAFALATNNYFQDIEPFLIENVFNITIANNEFLCFPQVSPGIEALGAAGTVSFASIGNVFSSCSSNYKVDSAGVMSAPNMIMDLYGSGPVYADVTTASQLESWQASVNFGPVVITPSGTTFTPALDGNQRVFEIDLTANSTLADFTYHVNNLYSPIIFKFKQDATGSRTVTYNAAYINHPTIGATANLCSYAEAHMTAANVIFLGSSINNVSCN